MQYLKDLVAKIEAFPEKEMKGSNEEVGEGEKVIGEVPQDLRKLFAYFGSIAEEAVRLMKEHTKTHLDNIFSEGTDGSDCAPFHRKLERMVNETKMLRDIFWESLRSELNIEASNIGVRRDWKVVEMPEKEDETPPSIHVVGMSIPAEIGALLSKLR